MSVYWKAASYYYDFRISGVRHCGSTGTDDLEIAQAVEQIHKARILGVDPAEVEPVKLRPTDSRFVYMLKAEVTGLIKIGSASNVKRRLTVRGGSPDSLSLIWFGEGGRHLEERAHRLLKAYASHGEWFHPTPEVMAFVDSAKAEGLLAALQLIAMPRVAAIFSKAA